RRVEELLGLPLDRVHHGWMSMSEVHRDETCRQVEVPLTVLVEQVRALSPGDDRCADGALLAPGRQHVLVAAAGGRWRHLTCLPECAVSGACFELAEAYSGAGVPSVGCEEQLPGLRPLEEVVERLM